MMFETEIESWRLAR